VPLFNKQGIIVSPSFIVNSPSFISLDNVECESSTDLSLVDLTAEKSVGEI